MFIAVLVSDVSIAGKFGAFAPPGAAKFPLDSMETRH